MALTIGGNSAALQAASTISMVSRDIETSMTRLSTGKRINAASDDAAGVAIASRINAEILGTNQSIRNALDGQGLIDTAEGAHKEVENILQGCVKFRFKLQMTPTMHKTEATCRPRWN